MRQQAHDVTGSIRAARHDICLVLSHSKQADVIEELLQRRLTAWKDLPGKLRWLQGVCRPRVESRGACAWVEAHALRSRTQQLSSLTYLKAPSLKHSATDSLSWCEVPLPHAPGWQTSSTYWQSSYSVTLRI